MVFHILTDKGVFEGEAETLEEMAETFEEEFPELDYEIFKVGECPVLLKLSDFREIYSIFGNMDAVMIFNRIAGRIVEQYTADRMQDILIITAMKIALTESRNDYGESGWDLLNNQLNGEHNVYTGIEVQKVIDDLYKIAKLVDPNFEGSVD